MSEFLGFMFFSIFEGIAVFSILFYIFRYDLMRYLRSTLIVIILINFQNFLIREELSISFIAPIVNLLMIVLFLTIIVRIPLVGSLFMSAAGYLGLGLIQTGIFYLSNGYFSLEGVQEHLWKAYSVQVLTGVIGFSSGWTLYRFGYGFTFSFIEKIRFSWERVAVITSIIIFIISLAAMMYFREVFLNLLVFALALLVFLRYSFRKEDAEA